MKTIWNEFVTISNTGGYVAKKDFWAFRNKTDGSFCMDFTEFKNGNSVMRFIVDNINYYQNKENPDKNISIEEYNKGIPEGTIIADEWELIVMEYNPTERKIVSTVSQGIKYADEVDWEKEQRQIDINKRNEYKQELKQATIDHLNAEVAVKDYTSIEVACGYATSTVPVYRQEGEQASKFRDDVWQYYYDKVENVKVLPDKDTYIKDLPALGWN